MMSGNIESEKINLNVPELNSEMDFIDDDF
jgi:hypothetical protein